MYTTPIIYKLDVSGNIRQWQGFATENTWYSESGLVDDLLEEMDCSISVKEWSGKNE